MSRHYFETCPRSSAQTTAFAAEMTRHLHSRQYLGKTLVICTPPLSVMRVARKQWLKLARLIQKQRASTLNADKILRFTYTITHMHRLQFTAKAPLYRPDHHVFFAAPDNVPALPAGCTTLYIAAPVAPQQFSTILAQMAEDALIVDYTGAVDPLAFHLRPKAELEAACLAQWQAAIQFLKAQGVEIEKLTYNDLAHIDAMDSALDALLGVSHSFLAVASDFQRALELAQPMVTDKTTQHLYNTLTLLAYRVQALSPNIMSTHMLRTYHEDETFFLHDTSEGMVLPTETLGAAVTRHTQAGRVRLAQALTLSAQLGGYWQPAAYPVALDRPFFESQQEANVARR